jgi:hypothetical protein
MTEEFRTQAQIIALRVAADLLEYTLSGETDLTAHALLRDEAMLREATFDTASDQDHLDLDLLDPEVFAAVLNEVRALLTRAH